MDTFKHQKEDKNEMTKTKDWLLKKIKYDK